jgi:DNA-binding MarR family transcriptional regulator
MMKPLTREKAIEGPDACYCLASRRGARFLTRLYEHRLAPSGLTSSQFSILSLLDYQPGMTVVGLANRMEMERTTLVRTLKPMKEAGLVAEGAEKQGRAVTLHMTKAGARKLAEGRPYWEAAQREFEDKVGPNDASQLLRMTLAVTTPEHS